MNETGELDSRNMPGRAIYALEIPNSLGPSTHQHRQHQFQSPSNLPSTKPDQNQNQNLRFRINLIQKPTPILLRKNPRKPPRSLFQRLHVLDVHHQHVSGLRGFDVKGAAEVVDAGEVYIADIVCRVVVFDLTAGPVDAFDFDGFVVFD